MLQRSRITGSAVLPGESGLEEERLQFMIQLAHTEGLLKEPLALSDVVDLRPQALALEMLARG